MPLHSIDPIVRATVEAIVNSLWGGIALAALVWCLLRVVRSINATTRYLIWWATLLVLVCLPLLAGRIPLAGSGSGNSAALAKHSATTGPETSVNPEVVSAPSLQAFRTSNPPQDFVAEGDFQRVREGRQRQNPGSTTPSQNHSSSILPGSNFQWPPIFLRSAVHNLQFAILPLFPFEFPPGRWAPILFAVWAVVALGRIVRVIWSYLYLQRLKSRSESLAPEHQSRLRQWLLSLRIRRVVSLCASSEVRVPVTLGLTNAVILFPRSMADQLTEAELDQVGLHESAHIRRWDDWTNLGQKLIEAVFFFHPAVLWIGRQLNLEREIACDDWVVALTGEPRPYAACLTKLVELTALPRRPVLAPGAVAGRKHLSRRIEMLLNKKRDTSVRLCKLGFLFSLGALVAGVLQFSRLSPLLALAEPKGSVAQSGQVKAPVVTGRLENQQEPVRLQISKAEGEKPQGEQRPTVGKGLERAEADEGRRILDKQQQQQFGQPFQQQPDQPLQQPQLGQPFPLNSEAWDFEDGFEFTFGGQKLEIPESELLPQLIKIARTDANAEVRREALRAIARLRSEASVDALISIYDGSKDVKTKEWIIRGLASNGSKKSAQKLISIAQSDSDPQMRLQALRSLGDLAGSSHPGFFPTPGAGTRVRPPKTPNPPNAPALAPPAPPVPARPPKPQEPPK